MSPCRHQLGRIHGRLTIMTVGLWVLLLASLGLAVLYERRLQREETELETKRKKKMATTERDELEERQQFLKSCQRLIDEHLQTLSRKRGELMRADDYGITDSSQWEDEKGYFLEKILFADPDWAPELVRLRKGLRSARLSSEDVAGIDALIEDAIDHSPQDAEPVA